MSIFNLVDEPRKLKGGSQGCSDLKYSEFLPTRDVTFNEFPKRFVIPFEMSSENWWIPSRSYMRIRCELSKGDGSSLTTSNQVAPNINTAANLFQSLELQLNGVTVSRITEHVAEVDTVEQRLSKSQAWMDSVGASVNWLTEDVETRINDVSSDGSSNIVEIVALPSDLNLPADAKIDVQANLSVFKLNSASGALPTIVDLASKGFVKNGRIRMDGAFYTIVSVTEVTALTELDVTVDKSMTFADLDPVSASDFAVVTETYTNRKPRKVTGFELIWRPLCLSLFKYSGALPLGKWQLICTPHNSSGNNYQIRAIETAPKAPTPTWGVGPTDIRFYVTDLRFYACNVMGDRVEDKTFFIDLEESRCQKALLKNTTSLTAEPFEIEPTSYAMTYCLQDVEAGNDAKYSCSRFRERDGNELKLNRLFISLGRNSYPSPDAEPSFKEGSSDDYTTQRYVESAVNSGGYFSEGGWESLQKWQELGALHHFQTPRDSQDRSTRCVVNSKFSTNFDNKANQLLISHYRKAVQVSINRGVITSVNEYIM